MAHSHLRCVRAWSRSCDMAVSIYRHSPRLADPQFAARMVRNAFSIPEALATAYGCPQSGQQDSALRRGLEAIAVLQTQLYLAAECGMLDSPEIAALNHQADLLACDLRHQIERDATESPAR